MYTLLSFLWQKWYYDSHFKTGWRNARSDHHVVHCSLVEYTIWVPCGIVLTGIIHNDLTAIWCGVDRWNTRWSDRHMVQCWLTEYTMIWPPCADRLNTRWRCGIVLTGVRACVRACVWACARVSLVVTLHNDLTAMWYSGDRRNTRWRCIESDSKILINAVCFTRVQLIIVSLHQYTCAIMYFSDNLPVFRCLDISLWGKHGGLYSRLILIKC